MLANINIIIAVGVALCGAVNAHPNWPAGWNHRDWEKDRPGSLSPAIYAPSAPDNAWWRDDKPTKTKHAPSITSSSTPTTGPSIDHACNRVRKLQSSSTQGRPHAIATIPAQLAYECITSVPFNSSAAVALLDSIRPFLDWQTTLQYVKHPPLDYAEKVQKPYDFWAAWDRIYAMAKTDGYANEYQFGHDLYTAFAKVHDGHFIVYPDSISVFSWNRRIPLVSVSVDGTSIPEVYAYEDVLDAMIGNASYTPSPLAFIDGRNSTEFLLEWAQNGRSQDPDALWNVMFYQLPQVAMGGEGRVAGTFSAGLMEYPGPNTTLTFANGTSSTKENVALVSVPFENVTSGADLYKEFFTTPSEVLEQADNFTTSSTSTTARSTATATPSTSKTPAPGYPTPVIRESANCNSGYFLDGEGYDDIAVLSVQEFANTTESGPASFQAVNTYFLERAVAENKTKLIIDLSANPGGVTLQGYDLFKQLFPHIEPYGGDRLRAHEALDYIGQEISHLSGTVTRSPGLNGTFSNIVASWFNYRSDLDANGKNFKSWGQKMRPQMLGPQPDAYTPLTRFNLSDVLIPVHDGTEVTGYGNRTNITEQKFKPENIIMVTDGFCASTCAIFSEFMRQQAGVKTIAFGGRPNTDIIQAVGGVKGSLILQCDIIRLYAQLPFQYGQIHAAEFYSKTILGDYNNLYQYRSWGGCAINVRNSYRQDDPSNIPLQFKYEPADCRIFYTPEMTVDMTAMWKTVADTAFNGIDHCIAGGIGSGGGYKRATGARQKHAVSRDLDTRQHRDAIGKVWPNRSRRVADGMMI